MKIKPKVKYKKIKKYLDGKSQQKKLSLLIIRVKGFRTFTNFKNEKKKKVRNGWEQKMEKKILKKKLKFTLIYYIYMKVKGILKIHKK